MTQDEYIISLATRFNFNINRFNNSVRFYSKNGLRVIELNKSYLKECQTKGIDPKELRTINPEVEDGC